MHSVCLVRCNHIHIQSSLSWLFKIYFMYIGRQTWSMITLYILNLYICCCPIPLPYNLNTSVHLILPIEEHRFWPLVFKKMINKPNGNVRIPRLTHSKTRRNSTWYQLPLQTVSNVLLKKKLQSSAHLIPSWGLKCKSWTHTSSKVVHQTKFKW